MLIINRFEGDYAVCEDENGGLIDIHKSEIPQNAREGSVLSSDGQAFLLNEKETALRRRKILMLRKRLRENNNEVQQ